MLRPEEGPKSVLLKPSLLAQLETVVDPRKSLSTWEARKSFLVLAIVAPHKLIIDNLLLLLNDTFQPKPAPTSMQPTIVHHEDLYHPLPPRDSLPIYHPLPFVQRGRAAQSRRSLLVTTHHPARHQRPERLPDPEQHLHGAGASADSGLEPAVSHGERDSEE